MLDAVLWLAAAANIAGMIGIAMLAWALATRRERVYRRLVDEHRGRVGRITRDFKSREQ